MNKAYLQEYSGNICLINVGKANTGGGYEQPVRQGGVKLKRVGI